MGWQERNSVVAEVFTPATPIDRVDLFAGRAIQRSQVIDAVFRPGTHAILYGERGVGKTSLASVLAELLESAGDIVIAPACQLHKLRQLRNPLAEGLRGEFRHRRPQTPGVRGCQ